VNRIELIKQIFGNYGVGHVTLLESFIDWLPVYKYTYTDNKKYKFMVLNNKRMANKIYWSEILERIHLASTLSLLRHYRWIDGIIGGAKNNNYIVFATSFRGLIESAADSIDALLHVPENIAEHYYEIKSAVKGNLNEIYILPELEDSLIHFSHARARTGKSLHGSHKAKKVRDYITSLQNSEKGHIHDFYSELCEITHPAFDSLVCFLDVYELKNKTLVTVNKHNEYLYIYNLCNNNAKAIEYILVVSINATFINFKLLNYFPIKSIKTPFVDNIDLNIELWKKIESKLERPK
jgi:hypothetical protein